MDIWDPCSINSMQGFRYFLTVVDDFSSYSWTFLLHAKSEVIQKIVSFIAYIENHFHTTAKIIRMDNGPEFSMKDFFSSKGIIHQTTCIETPEQNNIVERKHQHLLNITHALIFQAHLPSLFWDFVVQHATYLINCTPTPLLQNIAPYEKLHGKPCDISNLRVFGCLCYSSTLTAHRKKLDDRYVHGTFLGFPAHTKGYIFLNLKYHCIEISRHIIFYENHFPYMSKNDKNDNPKSLSLPIPSNNDINYDLTFESANTTPQDTAPREDISPHEATTPHEDDSLIQTIPDAPPRRSSRPLRPPTYLEDFHTQIPNASNVSSKYPIHTKNHNENETVQVGSTID